MKYITGEIDHADLLMSMDEQISKAKEEASSRKAIMEKVEKWVIARDEERWLEEYSRVNSLFLLMLPIWKISCSLSFLGANVHALFIHFNFPGWESVFSKQRSSQEPQTCRKSTSDRQQNPRQGSCHNLMKVMSMFKKQKISIWYRYCIASYVFQYWILDYFKSKAYIVVY